MSDIERFNSYVPDMHGQGMGMCLAADGKYVLYSEHERIVKDLETRIASTPDIVETLRILDEAGFSKELPNSLPEMVRRLISKNK